MVRAKTASPITLAKNVAAALRRWAAQRSKGTTSWLLGLLGVAGAVFLWRWFGARQPVRSWFSLQLAAIWLWEAYLAAACASVGYRLADRVLGADRWTVLEKLAVGYPAGVVVFVLGMYLGGFLHLLRPAFAVVLPGLLLAIGAPPLVRSWRAGRAQDEGPVRIALSGSPLVATAVGLMLLGVLYLGAMTPDAISYDASWNHLVIAQDYAREGRIIPFPGDWNKNLPHLGSVLNTWAFLVPGFGLPALRWMIALHTEFCVFVWTLVGIAAAGRWLVDRQQPAMWTAFALFPGIFASDSNIGGSADHFLGLFAAPLLLLTGRALPRLDRGTCVVWGVLAGGALMTKVQGIYLVAPLTVLLVLRTLYLIVRHRRGDLDGPSPTVIAATSALAAAIPVVVLLPHLVSNFVFFRNPVYPLFQDVFTASSPTIKDAALHVSYMLADWRYLAPAPLLDKLREGAKLAFTFSFVPHYSYVRDLPVFGSVFTLSLPFLLVLQSARRLWLGALIAMGAILTWAFTYWVDRNLQGVTPVLIAVTAAILARAWDVGFYARVGVAALVIVQISWAGNIYFQGADRVGGAVSLLRSTIARDTNESLSRYRKEYVALGQSLPSNAVLMLHDAHSMLGIDRPVVLDWIGFQGLFDYRLYHTPRDLDDRLREVGVTHVAWLRSSPPARSKQEELIFNAFADTQQTRPFGPMSVFELSKMPALRGPPYRVLLVAIDGYADGLYPVEALSTCEELPPQMRRYAAPDEASATRDGVWTLLGKANALFVGSPASVDTQVAERLNREFRQIRGYPAFRLLVRR